MRRCVAFLLIGLFMAGCRKQAVPADVSKVYSEVDTLITAGDTNVAINVLSEALNNKAYERNRGQLFSSLMNILLSADRVAKLKTDTWRQSRRIRIWRVQALGSCVTIIGEKVISTH